MVIHLAFFIVFSRHASSAIMVARFAEERQLKLVFPPLVAFKFGKNGCGGLFPVWREWPRGRGPSAAGGGVAEGRRPCHGEKKTGMRVRLGWCSCPVPGAGEMVFLGRGGDHLDHAGRVCLPYRASKNFSRGLKRFGAPDTPFAVANFTGLGGPHQKIKATKPAPSKTGGRHILRTFWCT